MCEYKIDNEYKQDYLKSKTTSTASSSIYVLNLVDNFETKLDKSIYNMNINEVKEMLGDSFKNSSKRTVKKNLSILRGYIDFCIDIKHATNVENVMNRFKFEDLNLLIDKTKAREKYISPEELQRCENILINAQDKLFLRLPYLGIRGRTEKGNTCEEIINLRMRNINELNNTIVVKKNDNTSRAIIVDTNTIELIKEVYEEEFYYENNGEMPENARNKNPKKRIVNHVEDFVLRIPTKDKYSLFDGAIINSRMVRIQKFVGNEGITINNLYFSGMITEAKNIMQEKGNLDKEDYLSICRKFNYGNGNPEKYWFALKELVEFYL